METINLMIVEDDDNDLKTFKDSVEVYNDKGDCKIHFTECKTLSEATDSLNNTYDGIIIDLRLDQSDTDGNVVMKQIHDSKFRIPVVITTGTPGAVDDKYSTMEVYKKGEYQYEDIFRQFQELVSTGLTRIMGGRGEFEKVLLEVFQKNLLPHRSMWIQNAEKDQKKAESALLRYTLNHLNHALDRNHDEYFPEEFYISPPLHTNLETGSILKNSTNEKNYILLTPACDLVIRKNGNYKTDRLLLIEIESLHQIQKDVLENIQKRDKKRDKLRELMKNNTTAYYHWLPATEFFEGGYANFRKSHSITKETLEKEYPLPPLISVSPSFVKDILARYSSFYARQGQPDIEKESIIDNLLKTDQSK